MKQIRFFLEYLIVLSFYYPIRLLPHRALFLLSATIGWFIFLVPAFRRPTIANVTIAFPEKSLREVKSIAKASISNFILALLADSNRSSR